MCFRYPTLNLRILQNKDKNKNNPGEVNHFRKILLIVSRDFIFLCHILVF